MFMLDGLTPLTKANGADPDGWPFNACHQADNYRLV